jgi:hypothetical protein
MHSRVLFSAIRSYIHKAFAWFLFKFDQQPAEASTKEFFLVSVGHGGRRGEGTPKGRSIHGRAELLRGGD